MALRGRPLRGLTHQHGAGLRHRLQAAGGVDEVAGDQALIRGADRSTAASPVRTPGARLHPGTQGAHGVDQVQRRAHGPLGVVLVGGRRAPHGHHGVADELLHGPAVPADDLRGHLEVAVQRRPDVLRVARFGERREAHEVGEEHRDQAAFGRRGRDRRGRRRRAGRGAAAAASAVRAVPQVPQNFSPGSKGVPHDGQPRRPGSRRIRRRTAARACSPWRSSSRSRLLEGSGMGPPGELCGHALGVAHRAVACEASAARAVAAQARFACQARKEGVPSTGCLPGCITVAVRGATVGWWMHIDRRCIKNRRRRGPGPEPGGYRPLVGDRGSSPVASLPCGQRATRHPPLGRHLTG